jgi:hypothetical protein
MATSCPGRLAVFGGDLIKLGSPGFVLNAVPLRADVEQPVVDDGE